VHQDLAALVTAINTQGDSAAYAISSQTHDIQGSIAASADTIAGAIASGNSAIIRTMAAQTAALGIMNDRIVAALAHNTTILVGIMDTLRHPLATAARERLERGLYALQNDWADDAVDEFGEAIHQDRYLAVAHLYLGIAHERLNNFSDAAQAYKSAVKYAKVEPSLQAGALLLFCAQVDRGSVSRDDAVATLESALTDLESYPELLIRHAALSNSNKYIGPALNLAPELVLAAVAVGFENAVSDLLNESGSIAFLAGRLSHAATELLKTAGKFGFDNCEPPDLSTAGPDQDSADQFLSRAALIDRRQEVLNWTKRLKDSAIARTQKARSDEADFLADDHATRRVKRVLEKAQQRARDGATCVLKTVSDLRVVDASGRGASALSVDREHIGDVDYFLSIRFSTSNGYGNNTRYWHIQGKCPKWSDVFDLDIPPESPVPVRGFDRLTRQPPSTDSYGPPDPLDGRVYQDGHRWKKSGILGTREGYTKAEEWSDADCERFLTLAKDLANGVYHQWDAAATWADEEIAKVAERIRTEEARLASEKERYQDGLAAVSGFAEEISHLMAAVDRSLSRRLYPFSGELAL
jgi:tetratricopeptide (TPR) repeat protein